MAGGVADAREAIDLGQRADQGRKAHRVAALVLSAPGGDVLAQQRDLARAGIDQLARLELEIGIGARDLGAAGVGDDAIGAEFVAAFLHGEKGGGRALAALGERGEFGDRGHVGVGVALALHRPVDHVGQAVIGLRADHHRHRRRARHDLVALGLRDASRDRDQRRLASLGTRLHQPADVGIDLLGRPLADMAGVEHHQIGLLALGRGRDAALTQHLGHALAIIDVHLAAEALDPVGPGGGGRFHRRGAPYGKGGAVSMPGDAGRAAACGTATGC